jgi:hypothetical protein
MCASRRGGKHKWRVHAAFIKFKLLPDTPARAKVASCALSARWLIRQEWRMLFGAPAQGRLQKAIMTIRSRRETVTFKHPFRIRGVDRMLPAGSYEVITDEEMIEGLSFAAFRRVATMIQVRAEMGRATELISIGSVDLSDAQRIDASAHD